MRTISPSEEGCASEAGGFNGEPTVDGDRDFVCILAVLAVAIGSADSKTTESDIYQEAHHRKAYPLSQEN